MSTHFSLPRACALLACLLGLPPGRAKAQDAPWQYMREITENNIITGKPEIVRVFGRNPAPRMFVFRRDNITDGQSVYITTIIDCDARTYHMARLYSYAADGSLEGEYPLDVTFTAAEFVRNEDYLFNYNWACTIH